MKLTPEMIKQLEKDLSKAKSYEDLMGKNGAIKKLMKSALEKLDEKWGDKYPLPVKSWRKNWENLSVFLTILLS